MKFTKDTTIDEVLRADASLAHFFTEIGMHCLGCPMSRAETIEEACEVHGTDCEALIRNLNAASK